ncbi:MAG: hypothetical protein PHY47_00640 [Lachnospiraceae bacterium]|nr:hypothetical protein [Lachnospiraceae bacterium]
MKNFFILFVLFSACSCASKQERFSGSSYLQTRTTVIRDAASNTVYFSTKNLNVQENYTRWVKEGRINNDSHLSCFNSNKSTNYLSLNDSAIKAVRPYASKSAFNTIYKKKDIVANGEFESINMESNDFNIRYKTESCFIKIDGKSEYVVSEIYY